MQDASQNRSDANFRNGSPAGKAGRRIRSVLAFFILLIVLNFVRLIWLELTGGPGYRAAAARTVESDRLVSARRGRIVTSDGTILAEDRGQTGLEIHYRYLETPSEPGWLRSMALDRLDRTARRDPKRVEAQIELVKAEILQMRDRFSRLDPDKWQRAAIKIQARVEQIHQRVNQRRGEKGQKGQVIVREELAFHPILDSVDRETVDELENNPERYPGVRLRPKVVRFYPEKSLASNLLGHLGAKRGRNDNGEPRPKTESTDGSLYGLLGLEAQYESALCGEPGLVRQKISSGGQLATATTVRRPKHGDDLVLSIDSRLQPVAERLLDEALVRRELSGEAPESAGGAAIVMEVATGAILAAASAPRFDPNQMLYGTDEEKQAILNDKSARLFDRTSRMAIAPGSVFKVVSAVALLEEEQIDFETKVDCRGYLHDPTRLRCAIFSRTGQGHGPVNVVDALRESCNVFFFHFAEKVPNDLISRWAKRFGVGSPTGIDLPNESNGNLPFQGEDQNRSWTKRDSQAISVGQGKLQMTPVQVAVMMSAIAGGGKRVTPHLVERIENSSTRDFQQIERPLAGLVLGLHEDTIETIQIGLSEVVNDPRGTAFDTVSFAEVEIAGKTGTAQAGEAVSDHAWFAGYFPAQNPQYVVVVAMEHSGAGAEVAGPIAKGLVEKVYKLGLLRQNMPSAATPK
jgi:penicillin-binding protein 2